MSGDGGLRPRMFQYSNQSLYQSGGYFGSGLKKYRNMGADSPNDSVKVAAGFMPQGYKSKYQFFGKKGFGFQAPFDDYHGSKIRN